MNPTTPKAHRITPGANLSFPGWLFMPTASVGWFRVGANHWKHMADPIAAILGEGWTHYHPFQETAPTSIPSPVSSQDSEGTGEAVADLREASRFVRAHASQGNFSELYCLANRLGFLADRLSAPNQPAHEAARAAAKAIWERDVTTDDLNESDDMTISKFAAIILKHCFPAPSPGASGEVFFAYFVGATEDRKACWTVQHGPGFVAEFHNYKGEVNHATAGAWARKVAVLLQADAKPAAPMLPGGEALFVAAERLYDHLLDLKNWPMKDIPDSVFVPFTDALRDYSKAPPLPGGTLVDGKDEAGKLSIIGNLNKTNNHRPECQCANCAAQADAGRDEK